MVVIISNVMPCSKLTIRRSAFNDILCSHHHSIYRIDCG
uniref:Uncharacterized protein n=1 Tax=Rhizophora mucronata TaxID=61149 RepID=A0A2P2QIJ7_RHIMU